MLESNLLEKPITDSTFVGQLIPQKMPFVMVDKLLFFSDEKAIAALTIKKDNLFTKNGFFSESGLIEHMAQTVALHTGYQYYRNQKTAPTGYLGAIKIVEIQKLPQIGDEIKTTAFLLHEVMGVTLVQINVLLEDEEIASAKMKTVIAKDQ